MKGGLPAIDSEKLTSKDLCGVYSEIADLLGLEAAKQFHSAFRGQQISMPVHFYSKEYLERQIIAEYDGHNIKTLATKYNYSEKWIRKILNKNQNH